MDHSRYKTMLDQGEAVLRDITSEAATPLERALLVISGLHTEGEILGYERRIDGIFKRFLDRSRLTNLPPQSRSPLYHQEAVARSLFEYLWITKPRRFGKNFLLIDVVDAQLDPDVNRTVGNCIGLTSLYSVLGLRTGLNLSLLLNSDHLLSRLRVGNRTIDMDHTDPMGFDCQSNETFREAPLWTIAANAVNSRGLEKESNGRFQEAMADYRKAIEIHPEYANAFNNRGNMRFQIGDLEGAMADYTEAIRLDPNFCEAHCNRGIARQRLGRREEARLDYRRALELDSGYIDARRCLEALAAVGRNEV